MQNNPYFYKYMSECKTPELYCFDLEQYNRQAKTLMVSVWTNFRGIVYYSEDFLIDAHSCCTWTGSKWQVKEHNTLLLRGLQLIVEYIIQNYVDLEV